MRVVVFLLSFLMLAASAFAGSVNLAWDVHTDTAVTGYRVYWGTASRVYGPTPIVVNGRTTNTATVPNLNTGKYFFAVTAVAPGVESGYSNEVIGDVPPTPPANLRVTSVTASIWKNQSTIQWVSNLPANSVVEYGLNRDKLSNRADAELVTDHTIKLTGLVRKARYYYRVVSSTDDQTAQSDWAIFITK